MSNEAELQRKYYASTAHTYDTDHVSVGDEHFFALAFLVGALDYLGGRSLLDIGSGTGRALSYIKKHRPDIRIVGVEPVAELRREGHAHGLTAEELVEGDATKLVYADGQFDIVCAFGVLHHIRQPARAVAEMLRVAKLAVFISDGNNFGQGRPLVRAVKQVLNAVRLWGAANMVKTRGKGYSVSDGDGIAYSYSVFNSYDQVRRFCRSVHILNTRDAHINLYRTAGYVAMLGIKSDR